MKVAIVAAFNPAYLVGLEESYAHAFEADHHEVVRV
jgi:hypothetical protein